MKRFIHQVLVLGCLLLALSSCGMSRGKLKVAIDPNWYPIDIGKQNSYVNGFTEDLLLEVAQYSGMEFEKISANWDTLLEGMNEKKYDVVLCSLPPYEYNKAKYDFSMNFLDLGPVLIIPAGTQTPDLAKMKESLMGIIAGDPAFAILQKYPDIVVRTYGSIPDLLNAIVNGDIQGALLERIPAVNYVRDLYAGK